MAARPESEFPPSGCRWCGLDRYGHFSRWSRELSETGVNGWHGYAQPTAEQIKTRMLARRTQRQGATS